MEPNDITCNGKTAKPQSFQSTQWPQPPRTSNYLQTQWPRTATSNGSSNKGAAVQEQPWYFPSLLSRAAQYMDSPTPSEREDSQRERTDDNDDRAGASERREEEEPWNEYEKREREEGRDDDDGESHDNHRHKRRRMVEESSLAFYDTISTSSEIPRMVFENTAAGSYFLLFKFCHCLGFNDFAVRWAIVIYLGHTLEAALTNYEHHSGSWRLLPLIPADVHVWIDNYLWNQPIVTSMLLYPHWFGEGQAPMWLSCILIPVMLTDTLISLKDDYEWHKPQITIPAYQRQVEAGFFDYFVCMAVAFVMIVSAQVCSLQWLLWVGLAFLNVPPAYFIWVHRQRIQYGIRMSSSSYQKSPACNNNESITDRHGNGKKTM